LVPIGHIGGVGAFGGKFPLPYHYISKLVLDANIHLLGWAFPSFLVYLIKGRDYLSGDSIKTVNGDQWAKEKVLA